ncbi:MAG: aminopeptidase [Armatimonadota bacterium]
MFDIRMKKLAEVLVNYSTQVKQGENVLIDAYDIPSEMTCLLVDTVVKAGGVPFVNVHSISVRRSLFLNATVGQMQIMGKHDLEYMKNFQAYIAVRGGFNINELSDVPDEKMRIVEEHWIKPVLDYRVNKTKWVVLRWPGSSMAQLASMSTEAFENFYFDVCNLDYSKMAKAVKPLVELMEKTDKVRIVGPLDTDIEFSIKGMPAKPCVGERNIPDGECFSVPIRDSVNGVMHYNAGTIYRGKSFDDIRLVFESGKIVEATSSNTKALNEILDIDEGARYIGEFSLGFNPHIKHAMRDILFDEKIDGSFHFTPGQAYEDCDNGNRSKIHWDMVAIQREDYGGGEIWFDGVQVRKNGRFVLDELKGLNPDNLI